MNLQELLIDIKEEIKEVLIELEYYTEGDSVLLETPKDKSNGDYSTNVAMKYARVARKAPRKIAEEITEKMDLEKLYISKIDIAGPGFINFYIDKSFLTNVITEINTLKKDYGNNNTGEGEHYNIEFVSVNPTGALHIGHARGASAGDSLSRILVKSGYKVTREYYVNDAGNQIHKLALSIDARYKELLGVDVVMPEDGYHGPEIITTAQDIIDQFGDKYLKEPGYEFFRQYGVDSLLEVLKKDLTDFRVEFDIYFSEKSLYDEDLVNKIS